MTSPTSLSHPEHSTPAGTHLLLRDGWTQPIHPTSNWSLHASALPFPFVSLTRAFTSPSLSLCTGFLFPAAEHKCHAGIENNTQSNGSISHQSETVLFFFSFYTALHVPKENFKTGFVRKMLYEWT